MSFAIFISDPSAELTCHISTTPTVTIGRSPENDIVLFDGSVSKKHCQIDWRNGVLTLSDLNSSHGVIVNGQKVEHQAVISPQDLIEIRSYSLVARALTEDEARRHQAGVDPQCIVPDALRTKSVEVDLLSRLGGEESARSPVWLDSIYRAFNHGEQNARSEEELDQRQVAQEEIASLNSVFHAVTSNRSNHVHTDSEPPSAPSSLNSIFEAVTPIPEAVSKPSNEPKSLQSIFNAVNPLSDEILNSQPSSHVEEDLSEEPILNLPTERKESAAVISSEKAEANPPGPKSLNSIFNAVNPLPDHLLSPSKTESGKSEPKSLNSVFNAVNPIPEELLGKSQSGELEEAHQQLAADAESNAVTDQKKPEPKSLNSIFNAVNPLAELGVLSDSNDEEG